MLDGVVTTHPIAGTRWRGATEEEDIALEKDLRTDEKERAEHVMLVDLGRNDLGRVCEPGTVKVRSFFSVERYSHVMHLVSTVTGLLRRDRNAFDAVTACFPAGTLSGAPKPRAMEIIEELEPTRRGLYGGIVGYLDFAGNADTAIAIRTALVRDGVAYVQAGGGIVADSDPVAEDTECLNKARAVLCAVATAATLRSAGEAQGGVTPGPRDRRAPRRGRSGGRRARGGVVVGSWSAAGLLWGASALRLRSRPGSRRADRAPPVAGAGTAPSALTGVALLALAGIAALVATSGVPRRIVGGLLGVVGGVVVVATAAAVLAVPWPSGGGRCWPSCGGLLLAVVGCAVLLREPRLRGSAPATPPRARRPRTPTRTAPRGPRSTKAATPPPTARRPAVARPPTPAAEPARTTTRAARPCRRPTLDQATAPGRTRRPSRTILAAAAAAGLSSMTFRHAR